MKIRFDGTPSQSIFRAINILVFLPSELPLPEMILSLTRALTELNFMNPPYQTGGQTSDVHPGTFFNSAKGILTRGFLSLRGNRISIFPEYNGLTSNLTTAIFLFALLMNEVILISEDFPPVVKEYEVVINPGIHINFLQILFRFNLIDCIVQPFIIYFKIYFVPFWKKCIARYIFGCFIVDAGHI